MKVPITARQGLIITGVLLALILILAAWREHSNRDQLTEARGAAKLATEQAKLQKSAAISAAALAETARLEAEKAHQVNAELRRNLDAERDQYRRLYEEATRRIETSEQQYQVDVAAIPTLQDADLAISTVRVLGQAYPGHSLAIVPEAGDTTAFRANRPTIEITMQAGLEVGHLREVRGAQADQLASQAGQIGTLQKEVSTWRNDFEVEQKARAGADASALEWQLSSNKFEKAAKDWETVDAARIRKARWATVKDLLITGGLAGTGILSGDKIGYGIAGGAVGQFVIRRVF